MPESDSNDADLVAELFRELFDRPADEREPLFAQHGAPANVRQEVEALLGQPAHEAFEEERLGTAGRGLTRRGGGIAWQPGTRIGDYEIVSEIARGGMGIVFEAKQRSLGRHVAIKVVRGAHFVDESDTQRFRAEAEAIAKLEHTGIVPVHEVGEHEGLQFYSMALFPRGSLKDIELPLSPIAAAELIAQICDAIHYAHTQNIVHRDLKPANVLLTDNLQPRVSDFGIAKDIGDEADQMTRTGAILGTPGFMAPEQANGDAESVGHLADIYGLGGVLFFALTGKPPIEGRTLVDTLHNVVHSDAPDVRRLQPTVPADIASICRKALEKAPQQRYGSAAAMAEDLRRFLRGAPTEARPLGTGQRLIRWCRRRPTLATFAALAVIGMVGGGTTSLLFALEANDKASALATANEQLQRSNRESDAARADAEAFSAFLLDDIVRTARKADLGGIATDVSVRNALIASLPQIEQRFAGRPLAEARARHEIGITLQHVGEVRQALQQLHLACEIRERELGPTADETLDSKSSLGSACLAAEATGEGVAHFEELLEIVKERGGSRLLRVLENLAVGYEQAQRFQDSFSVADRLTATTSGIDRMRARSLLAIAQARLENVADAKETIHELTHSDYSWQDIPHRDREFIEHNLLRCYIRIEDDASAASLGMSLLARDRKLHGVTNPITVRVAQQLWWLGGERLPPRVAMEALETLVRRNGDRDSYRNRRQSENAARMSLLAGFPKRALHHASRAHAFWYAEDPDHPKTFATEAILCEAMLADGQTEAAAKRLRTRMQALLERVRESERPGSALADQRAALRSARQHFEQLLDEL